METSPTPSGWTTPDYNEKSPVPEESSGSDDMNGDYGYGENPFTDEDVEERLKYLNSIEGQPEPTYKEMLAQMNAEGENSEGENSEETNNDFRPECLDYLSEEDWLKDKDNNETYESLIGRAGELNFLGNGSNSVQDVVEIDLDELIGSEEQNQEESQQFSYELLDEV